MMRIVVIGQAAFGAKVVETLMERGGNVVAVYAPVQRPGGKADPIKEAAAAGGIPIFEPSTFKNEEVFSQYRELKPDLTILAFVTDIIPVRYFDAATKGAICYHPSLLPRHRGSSAINWAVIMGDKKTGLTVFRPDRGIDTGPILLQKEVEIGPQDTVGSLYFERLFPMGVEAIMESVELIKENRAPEIPQDETRATYEPPCDDKVAAIDWGRGAEEIYNLIRGCDPQPGAYAYWKGEKVRFYGVKLSGEASLEPSGTIAQIDSNGIQIALTGARLAVSRLRGEAGGKVTGEDWAAEKGARVGQSFDAS